MIGPWCVRVVPWEDESCSLVSIILKKAAVLDNLPKKFRLIVNQINPSDFMAILFANCEIALSFAE